MSYEDCLEFCRKRMCVMGYFPDEIEAAAKEMFEEIEEMTGTVRKYFEEAFLKNKFFEYKADFAAKGCTEEEAEKAAAEALLQLADALDKLEMFE